MVPSPKHKHKYIYVYFILLAFKNAQSPSSCAKSRKCRVHKFVCNCHFQPCYVINASMFYVLFIRGCNAARCFPQKRHVTSLSPPINGQMGCFHFCCFVFASINNTIANIFFPCIWSHFFRIQPQKGDF